MSAIRSCTFVVILCCLNGITTGIVNSSYSNDGSEAIEIAPIPPNLFTEISVGKSDFSTDINLRTDNGPNKNIPNGFVFFKFRVKFFHT